jgi:hypothetical protein
LDISNGSEELQNNIINFWESYVNHPDNLNNPNDNLMREIDRFQHEIRENGDDGLFLEDIPR